ncbi:hypothetical protein ACFQ0K_17835 [Nocardioides caeni]|uniref:Uncharacterized protein n=1 Tax=Nocardioides caeni TaxID=574700 RepID=A0A4S8NAN1_9ACTN|nr:hypothetical protein [Nocardioides caeni]THV13373.1 hypothetical protein E9934_10450 [Nocardioides caeni]
MKPSTRRRRENEQLRPLVAELRAEGFTWAAIGRQLGVDPRRAQTIGRQTPPPTPTPPSHIDYPDWLDDDTANDAVRRVIERKLRALRTTRTDVLAWATDHGIPTPDEPGAVSLELLELYAERHDLDIYPAQAAHRSQLADAMHWAHKHAWERGSREDR